jgi:phospholipase/carboxylesterase
MLDEVRAAGAARLTLVGFSQGGMLAMDHVLHGGQVDALALLSSSRLAFASWRPRLPRLAELPVFIAHGRDDAELAFAAGEALRDAAREGGAAVTWLPFDGPHELPLVVWRALRKWLRAG